MKESNGLLIKLLEYIEQVEKLKRKPSYVVPTDIFAAWQADIKGLPGITLNLQTEGDELWLCIPRLNEIPPPQPDVKLKSWVTLSKSPDKPLELKNEIVIVEDEKRVRS